MKNLAGVIKADETIQEELHLAGIDIVKGEVSKGEVPYSITGKLGDLTFERAWTYWMVFSPEGEGLPIDVATQLHERKYPISGENQPEKYGDIIRVRGDCTCPHPNTAVKHYDAKGRELIVDPDGSREDGFKATLFRHVGEQAIFDSFKEGYIKTRYVPALENVVAKSVVGSYHIDSQVGLNEFVRVAKELC